MKTKQASNRKRGRQCRHKSTTIWTRFNPQKDQDEWICGKCGELIKVITRLEMVMGRSES